MAQQKVRVYVYRKCVWGGNEQSKIQIYSTSEWEKIQQREIFNMILLECAVFIYELIRDL